MPFVVTNMCLCVFCCDKHNFVATKVLSWQTYFCRDKRRVLLRQKIVAAPANDSPADAATQLTSAPVFRRLG